MPSCRYCWLGTVEYLRARELQDVLVDQVHDGKSPTPSCFWSTATSTPGAV